MTRLVVFAVLVAVAVAVALVLRHRQRPDAPTQPRSVVPAQLDRRDFDRPDAPWLVAVFTSATCLSCAGTWDKARQLACDAVAVQEIEFGGRRDLHERYAIEAVPAVLLADADGVVRASFLGPPSASDLWATLAELRQPGSVPPSCDHHGSAAGR